MIFIVRGVVKLLLVGWGKFISFLLGVLKYFLEILLMIRLILFIWGIVGCGVFIRDCLLVVGILFIFFAFGILLVLVRYFVFMMFFGLMVFFFFIGWVGCIIFFWIGFGWFIGISFSFGKLFFFFFYSFFWLFYCWFYGYFYVGIYYFRF